MYLNKLFCCLIVLQAIGYEGEARQNSRPIIGILAQEYNHGKTEEKPNGSYIAASYVKMVEASGARVVPIMIGQNRTYYKRLVDSVNGILLPGGDSDLWATGGYGEAAKMLFNSVLQKNRHGNHMPMYGVCLGFEALAVISAGMSKDVLTKVEGVENKPMNLNFLPHFLRSDLYSNMPRKLIDLLRNTNITSNHHGVSFTQEALNKHGLGRTWKPLSVNLDQNGITFISSMEHGKFPQIFGTQFHPEKIVFEWSLKIDDPHTLDAILPNRFFYDHLVEHARRNNNTFINKKEELTSLIYNYSPSYTPNGYFEQIYIFKATGLS